MCGGDDLGVIHLPAALRHSIHRLLDDLEALVHLQHAHQIAVVDIAVRADRDVEVEALVAAIGKDLAHVIGDAAAAQRRAAAPELDGLFSGSTRDALRAVDPEPVVGEQVVIFAQPLGENVEEVRTRSRTRAADRPGGRPA